MEKSQKKNGRLVEQWKHSANEQLLLDELVVKHILKLIGLREKPYISKLIASPTSLTLDLETKLKSEDVQFLEIGKPISKEIYQNEGNMEFEEIIYSNLVAAFAFLSSCYLLEKRWTVNDQSTQIDMVEASKGREIISEFQSQSQLEKVDKNISKTTFGSLFVWLDPVQQEIIDDDNPKQVIIGSASTGKTLLLQLKILDLCSNDKDSEAVIILPNKRLVKKYQEFLTHSGVALDNLYFVTPKDNWKEVLYEKKSCHMFVDELAAMNLRCRELNDTLLAIAHEFKPKQLLWVTIDFGQTFNSHRPECDQKNLRLIDGASKKHLMLIHRCTINVFNNFLLKCSPLIDIGHQYRGIGTETITLEPSKDVFCDCVKAIKMCLENSLKTWSCKDICVIMTSCDYEMAATYVLLYLELKTKFPAIDVMFESSSLSQEWPVVIIIGEVL